MRIIFAIAVAAMVFFPIAAVADSTTSAANVLAVEQLVDSIETTSAERAQQCTTYRDPAYPIARVTCRPIFIEVDPIARPFVRSIWSALGAAAIVNFGVRSSAEHSRASRFALDAAVLLYPLLLEHNARVIHASFRVRF